MCYVLTFYGNTNEDEFLNKPSILKLFPFHTGISPNIRGLFNPFVLCLQAAGLQADESSLNMDDR